MGSFGESLKRERELRDISLREIADATKISVRYLEALERNRFEALPGGVFNKGFIKAYANFIGADGDALVDAYMQEIAAREMAALGAAESMRQGAEGLHRPAEVPKRRANAEYGAPPPAETGIGYRPPQTQAPIQARLPQVSLKKLSAAIDERRAMERAATGEGDRPRLLAIAGSFIGGAGLVFALLLVARAVTRSPVPQVETPGSAAALVPPSEVDADTAPTTPNEAPPSLETAEEAKEPEADPKAIIASGAAPAAVPPPAASAHASERRSELPLERPRAALPIPPPPPPSESAASRPPRTAPAQGAALSPMDLRLEVTLPALVQVSCDGEDRLNRPLLPGEVATMRCFNLIRVSATDAGALRLVVNGRRCAQLGDAGSRIQGFAIRTDDVDSICPAGGGASDGRR